MSTSSCWETFLSVRLTGTKYWDVGGRPGPGDTGRRETNHSREPGPRHQPPELAPASPWAPRQWMTITQESILILKSEENILSFYFCVVIQMMLVHIPQRLLFNICSFSVSLAQWTKCYGNLSVSGGEWRKFYQFGWWSELAGQCCVSCVHLEPH